MYEKSKHMEIRNFIAIQIINKKINDGDKLYDKDFFINKFRINPSYLDLAYETMLKEGMIEVRSDYYYMTINQGLIDNLKNEFANMFVNDYISNMQTIGLDIDGAFHYVAMRMNANG